MNISFVTRLKNREKVTGAHFYDNLLIETLGKDTIHNLKEISINIGQWENNLAIAPLLYLGKISKEKNTDIFIFNSISFLRFMLLPFYIKFFKRKKIYAIHHHFMHRQLKGFKRKFYETFEKGFLKQMDKIILASPYVYDDLLKSFPPDKLMLFKIPFDKTAIYPSSPIKGNLTFTGTIEYRKGLYYLLQALVLLKERGKEYPLTIIGKVIEQPYYENLLKIIETHNLQVKFTGFISKEEIGKIFSHTDVFVFPSLLEGYGMALIEAQMYGLPIVSFDNSAMPYNVKNDINGFLVPTENITEYANAIEKIIEDRQLRERLSKGALENMASQNTLIDFRKEVVKEFNNLK